MLWGDGKGSDIKGEGDRREKGRWGEGEKC